MNTYAVRIERYCAESVQQDSTTESFDSAVVRDFFAAKKDGSNTPWPVHIPCCVDYLQIVTLNCKTETLGSLNVLSTSDVIETASIYPCGELYSVAAARKQADDARSIFSLNKDVLDKMEQEKTDLLVVTRGGNLKPFDKERDVILYQRENTRSDVWYNNTSCAKACALVKS